MKQKMDWKYVQNEGRLRALKLHIVYYRAWDVAWRQAQGGEWDPEQFI